jgi:hypothetical protein
MNFRQKYEKKRTTYHYPLWNQFHGNKISKQLNIFTTMKFITLFVLLVFGISISGCYVRNASPEKDQTLVIASDYLSESDTVFFKDFSKDNNVRVIIKPIDANSLIGEIRNKEYNHGIDLVMMKSLHSVYNLNRIEMFHNVDHMNNAFEKHRQFVSRESNFIGFGIDPFVCATRSDTSLLIRNYNDLKSTPFVNYLNEEDLIVMLAPLMTKMNKVKSYDWIKAFNQSRNEHADLNRTTARSVPALLTSYSRYQTEITSDSILSKYTNFTYPNVNSTGSFFDVRTMCIAQQAQHFTTATDFIRYYLKPGKNVALNKKINTLPVGKEQISIKLYRANSENLIQYFMMIQRILSKVA